MTKEWELEPNEKFFEYRGYKCIIWRGDSKTLCGYVVIPKGHILYGVVNDYSWEPENILTTLSVHGGITWAGNHWIEGYKDEWTVGFDCAHAWDVVPRHYDDWARCFPEATYKNIEYVTKEIESLVDQIISIEEKGKQDITFAINLEIKITPELAERMENMIAHSLWELGLVGTIENHFLNPIQLTEIRRIK